MGVPTDKFFYACKLGKQHKSSLNFKNWASTSRLLHLLHLDLFGPTHTLSIRSISYCFVIIDDFSRFTLVFFLTHKNDTFDVFKCFCKQVKLRRMLVLLA